MSFIEQMYSPVRGAVLTFITSNVDIYQAG